ncbi:MAG: hypothetical protein COU08_03980 [Candidatus Harrisonbacteria bacterium CG10_big_fil_rev_8_21_14_0_10_42_17]|uniref:DUF4201 domain-containing protein n=1 Tax=Candidatus Harrisonbacteria bacterium CG10_big_fil_rev_8_21_14_0_10_42_17 TaxID=1974584 RepID=A0A2M6WH87_9BACT|nr:MAG: hypothetical protein COU08_03980 [Candidatus Harrisonbacteria bacterium CG10_big_fil_rev_8_21_14_0_10_42_17]
MAPGAPKILSSDSELPHDGERFEANSILRTTHYEGENVPSVAESYATMDREIVEEQRERERLLQEGKDRIQAHGGGEDARALEERAAQDLADLCNDAAAVLEEKRRSFQSLSESTTSILETTSGEKSESPIEEFQRRRDEVLQGNYQQVEAEALEELSARYAPHKESVSASERKPSSSMPPPHTPEEQAIASFPESNPPPSEHFSEKPLGDEEKERLREAGRKVAEELFEQEHGIRLTREEEARIIYKESLRERKKELEEEYFERKEAELDTNDKVEPQTTESKTSVAQGEKDIPLRAEQHPVTRIERAPKSYDNASALERFLDMKRSPIVRTLTRLYERARFNISDRVDIANNREVADRADMRSLKVRKKIQICRKDLGVAEINLRKHEAELKILRDDPNVSPRAILSREHTITQLQERRDSLSAKEEKLQSIMQHHEAEKARFENTIRDIEDRVAKRIQERMQPFEDRARALRENVVELDVEIQDMELQNDELHVALEQLESELTAIPREKRKEVKQKSEEAKRELVTNNRLIEGRRVDRQIIQDRIARAEDRANPWRDMKNRYLRAARVGEKQPLDPGLKAVINPRNKRRVV